MKWAKAAGKMVPMQDLHKLFICKEYNILWSIVKPQHNKTGCCTRRSCAILHKGLEHHGFQDLWRVLDPISGGHWGQTAPKTSPTPRPHTLQSWLEDTSLLGWGHRCPQLLADLNLTELWMDWRSLNWQRLWLWELCWNQPIKHYR